MSDNLFLSLFSPDPRLCTCVSLGDHNDNVTAGRCRGIFLDSCRVQVLPPPPEHVVLGGVNFVPDPTLCPHGASPWLCEECEELKEPSQPQTMEYCIQSAPDPTTLTEHVRAMLKGGWVPQGGVSVIVIAWDGEDDRVHYEYSQGMVRVGGGVGGATREDA